MTSPDSQAPTTMPSVDRPIPMGPGVPGAARGRTRRLTRHPWWLLLVPGTLFLGAFFAYPAAEILLRSVTEYASPQTSGLDNLGWFFSTPANLAILSRTATTALLVTAVCLLLGYPYAYLATIAGPRVRALMLGVVTISVISSLLVRSYAWVILLQTNGPINDVLAAMGLGRVGLFGTTTGVIIAMGQILVPLFILAVYANLRGIDRRLLLAAESLGATRIRAFWRIYVPLSLPGVLAGCLLVFVFTVGFYVTPTLVGSAQNALISQIIVTQVNQLLAFGRAGAVAVVLLAMTLVVVAVVAVASRRGLVAASQQVEGGRSDEEQRWLRPGRMGLAVVGFCVALWLVVPTLTVVPISFAGEPSFAFPPRSWSTRWYENLLTNPVWSDALWTTLWVGVATTALATTLGTATAFGLARTRLRVASSINALVLAPLLVPLVITAVGIYAVFLKWGLVGRGVGFVLAHTVVAMPMVVVTVSASLRTFDRRLEDVAASLGAGPIKRFFTVTVPGIRAGLFSGALLAFVMSFDETVISLLLASPELRTLPVQMYAGISREIDPTVAAASTLTLCLTAGVVAAAVLMPRGVKNARL